MRAIQVLRAASTAVLLVLGACSSTGGGGSKNAAPASAFTFSCEALRCTFTDGSSDPDGSIAARAWTFGDGTTSAEASPVHTYGAPGTYTVTLKVTDDGGATGSSSKQVTMNLPPRASFDLSCSGLTCTFTNGSTDAAGANTIVASSWTFGDGAGSTEASPTHAYAAAGTFQVTLVVTDDGGLTDTASRTVTVTAPGVSAPVAAFSVSCSSNVCTFTDRSTDAGGTLTAWAWDFGDGGTSTERSPQHTYAADVSPMTEFTATLTVADDQGASAMASMSFTVSPPAGLQCRDAADPGDLTGCSITLAQTSRLEVEFTARECGARGNTFMITAPVQLTLFTDGCFEPPTGTVFTIDDNGSPFPAGTVIQAQMISGAIDQVIPPTLIVTGTTSPWQVQFDDGAVAPADLDILLTFREVP